MEILLSYTLEVLQRVISGKLIPKFVVMTHVTGSANRLADFLMQCEAAAHRSDEGNRSLGGLDSTSRLAIAFSMNIFSLLPPR